MRARGRGGEHQQQRIMWAARGGALLALCVWSGCASPQRPYRMASPELYPDARAVDAPCVFADSIASWQPGRLTVMTCSAWTSRGEFDPVAGDWIYFPNMSLQSVSRGRARCPECRLDVARPESPSKVWRLALHAPGAQEPLARYEGELREGRLDGQGRLVLKRTPGCQHYCEDHLVAERKLGASIEIVGRWRQGVLEQPARVVYTLGDGTRYSGEAIHDPVRGLVAHGAGRREQGARVWAEGQWREGLLHGKGAELRADGTQYSGTYVEGRWEGEGALKRADGSTYEGMFLDGQPHGRGVLVQADGTRYEGEFARGVRHGQGKLAKADGTRYEGGFARGVYHGQGALKRPDGTRYEGQWREGVPHGLGRAVDASGVARQGRWEAGVLRADRVIVQWPAGPYTRYEGALRDDQPHGDGTLVWRDGTRYAGEFRHGRMAGLGVVQWPDRAVYVGDWSEGQPHGCGMHRSADGSAWIGQWDGGAPVVADCPTLPSPWKPEVLRLDGLEPIEAGELLRALKAQRRTTSAMTSASAQVATLRARYGYTPVAAPDAALRHVELHFSTVSGPMSRLLPRACVEDLSVTLDGAPVTAQLRGLLDAEVLLPAARGATVRVCVNLKQACGGGPMRGCVPIDLPSDEQSAPVRRRVVLERAP